MRISAFSGFGVVTGFLAAFFLALFAASLSGSESARLNHARLMEYLDGRGEVCPVKTPQDWKLRRDRIIRGMEEVMGKLPDRSNLPPLDLQKKERVEGDTYVRFTISFRADSGEPIPAYLYIPRPHPPRTRYPAVLALHPTSPLGKGVPAGLSRRPNRAYALELARRGYVVLAPDYPSFGDYRYDFGSDRYESGTMKGIVNHMRAVDLLVSLPEVDPDRIAVIGHSLGGHNAMFVGVFDPRVKVIVSSCGWTAFHDYYEGNLKGWSSDRYMPRISSVYGCDPDRMPFDFYEVVAALAPRAFFSSSPVKDHNFAVSGVRKVVPEARKVYDLLGASENLRVIYPECGHDFPPSARNAAYRFIDAALGHHPSGPRESAAFSHSKKLTAAVAAVDITPPAGCRMSGYFTERLSTGVHDPLLAKALYLRQGEEEAVLVFCDMIGVSRELSQKARSEAARRTGIPERAIVVAATHSHTGPLYFGALREFFHARAVTRHGKDPYEPVDLTAFLCNRIVDVICRAQALASPTLLKAASEREEGISFNRRFVMKDGKVRFNPGKLNPNILKPAGPVDPEVGVLFLAKNETVGPRAALTNFALHLDTVGGTLYAADYPFYLEKALKRKFGSSFFSLFATGPCGDINHIDVSTRRAQRGPAEAQRIGERLAGAVERAFSKAKVLSPRLASAHRVVRVPLQSYSPEEIRRARRDMKAIGSRKLTFLKQVEAYKIMALQLREGTSIPLEVQVVRLSDEAALVALPGEIFVELGLEIKKKSPFPKTFVIELSNDAPGYIPTLKAFREGSYETVNSRVKPGGGEKLVETALDLLNKLK